MSGERAPLPSGGKGLLRGSRARSYGSLVRSPLRQSRVEHHVEPGDTLPGLALKYGVSTEQIKRANRLYTNDSIFLKKSLSIPVPSDLVPSDPDHGGNGLGLAEEDVAGHFTLNGRSPSSPDRKQADDTERTSDLSPVEFLKRLDGLISQSKQAAVRGCQDAEKRVAALESACTSGASDWRPLTRSQSVTSRIQRQQASHVPLTVTRLTENLRDREDEIFQL